MANQMIFYSIEPGSLAYVTQQFSEFYRHVEQEGFELVGEPEFVLFDESAEIMAQRLETSKERDKRLSQNKRREDRKIAKEMAELERLKKKYEA